jgi:signal transduction histidine kinase
VPFRSIDDPAKLRRLLESVLLLEADISLPVLLRHIVEEACSMASARYGALGVLNEKRTELAEFITVGLDTATEEEIGPRPKGRGVLGLLISEPAALRLADLHAHPNSFGVPKNHPPMTSFLGVPVQAHDEIYGNLYLTDKIGATEFSEDDEQLVKALAIAAGIAIENNRLHERVRDVAVFDDRDRIARDLHDDVIQRLFAIGLSLQGLTKNLASPSAPERLNGAIADIDQTIRQIRSSIFELSLTPAASGVRSKVLALVGELEPVLGFEPRVIFDGPVDTSLPDRVVEALLLTLREALTNVGRHAGATSASVTLSVESRRCTLVVADDGKWSGPAPSDHVGLGLANLRQRAKKLDGELTIETSSDGTTLSWQVPNLVGGPGG